MEHRNSQLCRAKHYGVGEGNCPPARECIDWLPVSAALIMCSSFMLVIRAFTDSKETQINVDMYMLAFLILETVAVYSSLGVLTVNLLVEACGTKLKGRMHQVLLLSLGCSLLGALVHFS